MNTKDWNMIEDDQLEQAAGGNVTMGDRIFSDAVDGKDAVIGENYFVVLDDEKNWAYGTLTANSDQSLFGKSERYFNFQLSMINGNGVEVPGRYKSSLVTLYKNCFTSAQGSF